MELKNYNLDWLIQQNLANKRPKYIFFWGHQPNKDGRIGSSCFSQWWPVEFESGNVFYKSAEHWMMAKKAELFKDQEIRDLILKSDSPAEARKLGRNVKNFDQSEWEKHRFYLVVEGNLHKFQQNESIKQCLIQTKDRILVEASPVDDIWGIGLSKDHPNIENPSNWKGLNLLGFALMEVRDILLNKVV